MDFRILGPLEVHHNGRRLALGGLRQRALLARLLIDANSVVSSDELAAALWGDEDAADHAKALQVAVSRLRRALEPGPAHGRGSSVLVTRAHGYELVVPAGALDAHRFEQGAARGREELQAGRSEEAGRKLHEALALWRGPPLADLAYERFAEVAIARLEEQRLCALEDRVAADLELGRHAALTAELEDLVTEHPYREGLWRAFMLSLYRSGRQAEALEVYRRARAVLVDELGIEPGRALKDLERGILAQDPVLDVERPPATRAVPGGLVGREREIARVLAALDSSRSGSGAAVLIGGEPGIGKSRLAEELVGRARERRSRVLIGRCWEAGGAPPYWPWVQALRAYIRSLEAPRLRAHLGADGDELATVLPELRELLPEYADPPPSAADGDRFGLFTAVAAFLRRASAQEHFVLVLDDLHAADEPSLLLLRFLVAELHDARVLVVGCYRDTEVGPGHPLVDALPEMSREGRVVRVALAGLDRAATTRLIEAVAGHPPAPELADHVYEGTGGNPLYAGQIAHLVAAGVPVGGEGALPVPDGVREAIRARLRRHPDTSRHVLTLASVLGREFDLDALADLCGLPEAQLQDALEDVTVAGLVGNVPGTPGRMRFSHVLIRDVVYEDVPSARRPGLHREAGEALEVLYGLHADPHRAELAHHFLLAGRAGAAKALRHATGAGRRAAAQLGFEEAARHYESALALDIATDEQRCELLVSLGDVLSRAGRTDESKEAFRDALSIGEERGLPEAVARAALGYGGRFIWGRAGMDRALVGILERALAAVGDSDSPARVQLLTRLAAALRDDRLRDRRVALAEEAVAMARRIGQPVTLAYALEGRITAIEGPDNVDSRLEGTDELIALGEQIGDRERVYTGHDYRLHTFWVLGDRAGVDVELGLMGSLADELRQPAQHWHQTSLCTALALMEGRFEAAEELISQAAARGQEALSWNAAVSERIALFVLRREQGRLHELEDLLARSVHEFPALRRFRCALAHLYAEVGREEDAVRVLDDLLSCDLAHEYVDAEWLFAMTLLADAVAAVGDVAGAERLYAILRPYEALYADAPVEGTFGSVARGLGVLATTGGRFDDAERHFEHALHIERRMRARPWLAHTQHGYAAMRLQRARPGDAHRARDLLGEAVCTYGTLGMGTWADRAAALVPADGVSGEVHYP